MTAENHLNAEHIQWLAHLARLHLTGEETAEMTGQLDAIVEYVKQLQQVNTEGVEPLAHPIDVSNVFRDDERRESLPLEKALLNAPSSGDGFFLVPAVFE